MKQLFTYIFALSVVLCSVTDLRADILTTEQVEAGECLAFQVQRTPENCEKCRKILDYPDYYCDCSLASTPFYYGIDTIINSVTWFVASINDLTKNGMTAYWFANGSVAVDMIFDCDQNPLMSAVVPQNRAMTLSHEEVSSRLGSYADQLVSATVYLRMTPDAGVSGRILGFTDSEGPHSTCDSLFEVFYRMPYWMNHGDNVLRMPYSRISNEFFVLWKSKDKRRPLDITIAKDCAGTQVLRRATLQDSVKVYFPDSALRADTYSHRDSVYFLLNTTENGLVMFYNVIEWIDTTFYNTLCDGKEWVLSDTILTKTTSYSDTVHIANNICSKATYNLEITVADTLTDTLYYAKSDFPKRYQGAITIRDYGDYIARVEGKDGCVTVYMVNVQPITSTNLQTEKTLNIKVQNTDISFSLNQSAIVSLRDILGREIYRQRLPEGEQQIQMQQKGSYILRVESGKQQIVKKIIIN